MITVKFTELLYTPLDKPYEIPRSRLLPTLVVFVFVLGFLYTLFLFFSRFNVNGNIATLEAGKLDVENKIEALRAEEIEELFVAQGLKESVGNASIEWSKVVRSLQDLTPVTVFLSSYSTSEDGGVQLTALGDTFGSVADTISALRSASDFADVFVPSVTLGTTSDGQSVVSLSLQLHYLP